jgi:predicted secreted Zn-dependent protease
MLKDVGVQLNRLPEWGRGGGMLRTERLQNVKSPEVTVKLFANLQFILPQWEGYDQASPAARAEWDRMLGTLRVHEQRHLDIAIEEANSLAVTLVGEPISKIASMVTAANREMARRQRELDNDTESGSKAGVQYGGVSLDTTIQ